MLFGGGGCRGGGGSTIIGGRDLSMLGSTEAVRDRLPSSSTTEDKVDSMDCRLSDCDVRGRAMQVALTSRMVVLGSRMVVLGEGVATDVGIEGSTEGAAAGLDPVEEGGMNWNC